MRANRSRKRHDTVAPVVRRKIMQAVKSSGTDIEETVASLVRELTMPFRRNVAGLPGRPDLCNKTRRWAIFVNGCFWHCHTNCAKTQGGRYGRIPKTNSAFWQQKLLRNRIRDHQARLLLRRMGYRVLTVWQCQCELLSRVVFRGPGSGGVLQDSVGEHFSFENENDLVMPVESSPASAG
jgi:DNA mismatch endonuclease (patch repair protein)